MQPLCGDDVIYDVIKNGVYRQRRTFNTSLTEGKNKAMQVNCWKNKQTETGVIID